MLKPCKECGKEVSSSAKRCPHCGKKLKMGLFLKMFLWIFAFIIMVIALPNILNIIGNNKETDSVPVVIKPEVTEDEIRIRDEERKKLKVLFNIPALLEMNIRDIKKQLGDPVTEFVPTKQQWDLGITGTDEYKRGHTTIQIDYLRNGMIPEIALMDDRRWLTKEDLFKLGDINPRSLRYRVKVVDAIIYPGVIASIIINPL